jgi:hypothetical protein
MADIISPQQQGQQQQLAQMQQQGQQMMEAMAEMKKELAKLQLQQAGKVIEGQTKTQIVKMQEATKLAVAEINASKDANESMAERENDTYHLMHESAHELGMQAHDHAHQQQMAERSHQQALEQGQQQADAQSMQSAQDAAQSQAQQEAAPAGE